MIAEPTGPAWDAACLETNWLVYKLVPRPGKKPTKIPTNPRTGGAAPAADAARLTLDEALERGSVGYLPRATSALIGIDLDDCIAPWLDAPDPWAADLLALCPSWVERSPSGTGVRCILAREGSGGPDIVTERRNYGYYGSAGRFFTVTFDPLANAGTAVCAAPALVEAVLARAAYQPATNCSAKDAGAPQWFGHLPPERQDAEAERMLAYLTDPKYGDYDLWLRISMAVYRASDSTGFEAWDSWCQGLPGYDPAENAKKWETFGTNGDVSVGTLIHHASAEGYSPPGDASALDPATTARLANLARLIGNHHHSPRPTAGRIKHLRNLLRGL